MKITDGPREKLIRTGIKSLKDEELLALLIKTGNKTESVIDLSKRILNEIYSLPLIKDITLDELLSINGIGISKASTILASLELSKRVNEKRNKRRKIYNPEDIFEYIYDDFLDEENEKLYIIFLNSNNEILSKILMESGSFNKVIIDSREIIKRALKMNSVAVALAHNHPSGNLKPSKEDEEMTENLIEKLKVFDIILLDHIVVTRSGFSSILYGFTKKM